MDAVARHPAGPAVLVLFALLEATVFPGPTEALLVVLTLGKRERAWRLAAIATVASLVGGLIGYALGGNLYDAVARPLLDHYGMLRYADRVTDAYRGNAFIALATSGYTPVPYLLYTMLAGAADIDLTQFLAGSAVGRTLKYLPIAAAAYVFGHAAHAVLRRVGTWILLLLLASAVALVVIG